MITNCLFIFILIIGELPMLPNSNPNSATKLMSSSKQRNEFNDDLEAAIEGKICMDNC